jgi:L-fuculose-phosphate aldolase
MNKIREIAKYGRLIHEKDLVIGAGGNISERDGEFLIIKRKGANMADGNADDYIRILFEKTESEQELLSTETPMHVACYRARTDINALIHVHSPIMIAAAEKTDLLKSTSYEFDCILQREVPVLDYIEPGSVSLAEAVSKKLSNGANAVMMKRHGAISSGRDIEEAYLRVLALERACLTFLHS